MNNPPSYIIVFLIATIIVIVVVLALLFLTASAASAAIPVGRWVLENRLEGCRKALRDPQTLAERVRARYAARGVRMMPGLGFTATGFRMLTCSARYTEPIPPDPSIRSMR